MRLKLGFSPCPNDTYMIYGLLHGTVGVDELVFDVDILDVEELNQHAKKSTFDISKMSFKTYYDVSESYDLLTAGAALGRGNGPLLIASKSMSADSVNTARIAVPGMDTTATFLLNFAYPKAVELYPMLFSDIEGAIRSGAVDAGVIIHETRFMYSDRGFQLIDDLGAVWEKHTGQPIPLGCFAVRKELDLNIKRRLGRLISESISFSDQHYDEVLPYLKQHAQELRDDIIKKHVHMFVNAYSKELGQSGRGAVQRLFLELNRISGLSRKPCFI